MKKTILLAAFTLAALANFAQDTTIVEIKSSADTSHTKADTIRVGSMVIIKKGDLPGEKHEHHDWTNKTKKNSRLKTSWLTLDLGYSNFTDKTNYGSADMDAFTGNKDFSANDFSLRNGKSFNINVWIVRQRYGLTKNNVLNISYGLMIETNNYRFENPVSFRKGGPPYVFHDSIDFSKNKLATSYFTVPIMLGFDTKPNNSKGFTMSAGVSVGYLYSSRNKQISEERGKQKNRGSFNLEPWKVQFVAEAGFHNLKLYGSYAPASMFKSGLDFRPYNIGLRLGGWD